MDRSIVYPGSIPLDTDLLATNRNAMIALGALISATLGVSQVVDGLAVAATAPATLSVVVGAGSITQFATVDQNAYGSLAADTADSLVKMGVNLGSTNFTLAAPTTSGQAISYLIEAAFQEADANAVVLPYYNAANPAQPYLGPNNTGVAQATQRTQRVQLQLKAGAPAISGTQSTPSVDTGWSGLAVINVSYGQTQITAGSISVWPQTPTIPFRLPALRPGFSQIQTYNSAASFVVPTGVSRVRVTVIGGGGGGGTHATIPGGGGGAGGQSVRIISGLTSGSTIPITVGTGGLAPSAGANGNGGAGGTSSFGVYASATGGQGGGGGTVSPAAGGGGGSGVGGDVNFAGALGTDSIIQAARGGDGGGPGGGRGTTGFVTGISAPGFGGGGGGGGSNSTTGSGTGAQGGNGCAGLVIVEF